MRAEVVFYTGQVQRHWGDVQRPLNQPQPPGTEALHSPAPLEAGSVLLELCVSLAWRSRTYLLVYHPVLILGLAGHFCLALPCTRKMCSKASMDPKVSGKQISKAELLREMLTIKVVSWAVCVHTIHTHIHQNENWPDAQVSETGNRQFHY